MPPNPDHSLDLDRQQRLENLFCDAVQLQLGKRAEFVRATCGADLELRDAVVKLLDCHEANEESGFILDHPAVPLKHDHGDMLAEQVAEYEGDTIGRYRLLEKIGEGGMGVVYLAEQLEDVQRKVALKIIKLGMDTRRFIARFETERQAMSMFNHPNIARVLDAGATQTGRPYLVMELVHGPDILEYVKKNRLGLQQRLKLFIDVCHAIQHSHQKAIVHRDLKPSNILVTTVEGNPVPKVIDFGVAKALHHRLTDRTMFTHFASIIGTPQYMSPEQAEMGESDIDTRSDIFSLGILLYELTTGTTPLERRVVERMNPIALLDAIRKQEIETPSTRISKRSSGDVSDESFLMEGSSGFWGELDCIVMKAVSRERAQRYSTAVELADDIQRLLDGEPVEAVPPTRWYYLRSYLRRHKGFVTSGLAIAGLLLISTVACSLFAWNSFQANLVKDETVEKLKSALVELQSKHEKLQVAERSIRETADNRVYEASLKSAVTVLRWKFYQEVKEFLPTYVLDKKQDVAGSESQSEPLTPFVQMVPHEFLDVDVLLDLENKELCESQLQRIRYYIESLSANESPRKTQVVDNEGNVDLTLQAKLDRVTEKIRCRFYRVLHEEYRATIGDRDPRIAKTLNLLALALADSGNLIEAESRLREAIAVTNDQSTLEISRSIMKTLK